MENVYLITEGQVKAASLALEAVAQFIEAFTPDDDADPDYAYTRARAFTILRTVVEAWRDLPRFGRIKQ